MDVIGRLTLRDILERRAAEIPDKLGWIFESEDGALEHFSCREFDARINRVAAGLQGLGVGKGDKVAIRLPNSPDHLITWCACAKIGAVAVPTITSLTVEETQFVLELCEASIVVTDRGNLDLVSAAVAGCPNLRTIVVTGPAGAARGDIVVAFHTLLDNDGSYDRVPLDSRDELQMLFTSGTTSKPKAVVLTHANAVHAAVRVASAMQLTPRDRNLSGLPFFHANCQVNCVSSSLVAGATIILLERFSVSRYWEQVRRHDATITTVILPAVLVEQPPTPQDRNHSVRLAFAGGLPLALEQEFEERFAVKLLMGYGLTEAMVDVTMSPPFGPRRSPSLGLPSIGRTVRIVDDSGVEVPNGATGEIVVEGEPGLTLMKGYYRDPGATAEAFRGGVLHTGDIGRFDEFGYLHFVGRIKDMIKRGGENVAAAEVEEVLSRHSAVVEAAVVGIPDVALGEAVMAFILLADDKGAVSADELAEHCRAHLAPFKVPARFEFRDELPRTSIGKVAKATLRAEVGSELDTAAA